MIFKVLAPQGAFQKAASPGGGCNALITKGLSAHGFSGSTPDTPLKTNFSPHPAARLLEPLTGKAFQR